jgi:hypothetical protein
MIIPSITQVTDHSFDPLTKEERIGKRSLLALC